jgi:hypothetical protein
MKESASLAISWIGADTLPELFRIDFIREHGRN